MVVVRVVILMVECPGNGLSLDSQRKCGGEVGCAVYRLGHLVEIDPKPRGSSLWIVGLRVSVEADWYVLAVQAERDFELLAGYCMGCVSPGLQHVNDEFVPLIVDGEFQLHLLVARQIDQMTAVVVMIALSAYLSSQDDRIDMSENTGDDV